jgi:hypothetical protein
VKKANIGKFFLTEFVSPCLNVFWQMAWNLDFRCCAIDFEFILPARHVSGHQLCQKSGQTGLAQVGPAQYWSQSCTLGSITHSVGEY